MDYLVKVGGELYLPCQECSVGEQHYHTTEVEILGVDVDKEKPLKPYLEGLITSLREGDFEDYDERVNLVWDEGKDLEASLWQLGENFDFFARKCFRNKLIHPPEFR